MSKVYIESLGELAEELNQGNVLLVGAPSMGKTYELLEVFKQDKAALFICDQQIQSSNKEGVSTRILSAGELGNDIALLDKYGKIIIDDFYKVSVSLKEESLKMILSRKQGVCLTTTLYRGEKALQKFGLTNFKPIFYKVDKTKAKEKITEYLCQNIVKEAKDKAIDKIVKHSEWSYPLDNNLWKVAGKEYSTYIPYWFVDAFLEFGESGLKLLTEEFLREISVSGIDASLHGIAHKISESDLGEIAKEFYHEVIPTLTGALPVLLYGTSSGFLVGAFAILRKIIGKRQEKVEEFKPFVSLLQMRPQDIETLEKKLDCPPLTLFTIRELMKPGNLHKLHEAAEATKELKEKLEIFEKQHAEGLQKLDELETKWKENENKLQQAEEITQCFKGINKTISDSIKEDIYPSFDTLGPLKKQGIIPKNAKIKIIERDEIAAGIIKAIDGGKKLILIKGKGGVGKSSLMTFLAEKIRERGFFVGVPVIGNPFLELKVEQEKHRTGGCILLTEYGMKQTGNIITGLEDPDLQFMIKFLVEEKCTAVIMECRSEYTLAFKTALEIRGLDIPCYEIELHGVEKMEDVVKQVFNTSKVTEQLEEIKRVSRENSTYNPLVAILAASWINKGGNLSGLSSDRFLEKFVDDLFFKDKTQEVQRIFTLLSLCNGIEREDLKECKGLWAPTGDFGTRWGKIETVMKSYLLHEEDIFYYAIKPDLISEVIFKNKALGDFFCDYLDMIVELKFSPTYCTELADNLSKAYQANIDCINEAHILLEKVKDPSLYYDCLGELLYSMIPIDPVKIRIENLVDNYGGEEKKEDMIYPVTLRLARLFKINLAAGKEPIEALKAIDSLVCQAAKLLSERVTKFNQERFISNFYLCIVSRQSLYVRVRNQDGTFRRNDYENPLLKTHFEIFQKYVKSIEKINPNLFKIVVYKIYCGLPSEPLVERWKEEFREVLEGY